MLTMILISLALGLILIYFWLNSRRQKELSFIENYQFPQAILDRARQKHDYLSHKDMLKVAKATKDYFYICNQANGKMVAMPSEIVDVLWHEFILFTREYAYFCKKGLGRFLHHIPTEAMESKTSAQEGIRRAWRLACAKANINPKYPTKLPLLFVIDKSLEIKGGFKYDLNCNQTPFNVNNNNGTGCGGYCATDIGCASGCAGETGGSSFESGFFGDSGGDGGSSCGGGCGGD